MTRKRVTAFLYAGNKKLPESGVAFKDGAAWQN